jgi:hypothetical protein
MFPIFFAGNVGVLVLCLQSLPGPAQLVEMPQNQVPIELQDYQITLPVCTEVTDCVRLVKEAPQYTPLPPGWQPTSVRVAAKAVFKPP